MTAGFDFKSFIEGITALFAKVGWPVGLMILLVLYLQYRIQALYTKNIQDKQHQIDRIAAENKEYRDRLTAIMDKQLGYKPSRAAEKPKKP